MARRWWPLAALLILAAALRLSTLHLQSFWYDEAYVPVHTLHPSLTATLRSVVHRENTPPLWYVLIWAWSRLFGTGEVALRLPSALAGIATVAFAWGIGSELAGRRAAIATAVLVAFNPLFVWYSQEARAYGLFVALIALAMWCWLRADAQPTPRRLTAFAVSGAAALATHYFAVFLLAPMCLWLLRRRTRLSVALPAVAAIGAVGLALVPLALAQGGHGTQWIGAWALASRLEAIPQYFLTGYSAAPLGHGIELLVALEILAAIGYGLWRVLTPRESEAALLSLGIAACGVLIPLAMAVLGADYLAPRNVVAAMIPLTAGIAVIAAARRTGRTGLALVGLIAVTFAALSVDVDLSPRLQRGDWRGLAATIGRSGRPRAVTTVELGSAPLEYYLPPLRNLRRGAVVEVSEIDETGYAPLLPGAGQPPAPGFRLVQRRNINGMLLYRFLAPTPRTVSQDGLRAHVIAEGRPEVLVGGEKE
ncbi:MAG TPA: glycosyltransferase family 39 protein [Solirubrobacteraceae bacterium]|jgi:mannosyltransferase|nr:glycosyltransferase family 39 protein [Solirubrobacteraceae bacterium]